MTKTIVFIHGMFQNAKSWDNWIRFFSDKGYQCIAESWPYHEAEPAELRKNIPEGLGDLHLKPVIDKYAGLISYKDPNAILIGHSVGGLIVQSLINQGVGKLGVCISSVAPNKMLSWDWSLFRNAVSISNPFKGDDPYLMTPELFHQNFCNTMTREESDEAYEKTATHDSRNIFRDCLTEDGHVDFEKTNTPLLFVAGDKDEIIPPELCERNAGKYRKGLTAFKVFEERGHYICNQPGWQEVAGFVAEWVSRYPSSKNSIVETKLL